MTPPGGHSEGTRAPSQATITECSDASSPARSDETLRVDRRVSRVAPRAQQPVRVGRSSGTPARSINSFANEVKRSMSAALEAMLPAPQPKDGLKSAVMSSSVRAGEPVAPAPPARHHTVGDLIRFLEARARRSRRRGSGTGVR